MYDTICRLHDQGTPVKAIARQLKMSRTTVYAHLRRGAPPEPKVRTVRPSDRVLAPYLPYLIQRWRESGASSQQLWREIQAQGYRSSARTVRRLITALRRASRQPPRTQSTGRVLR